MTDYYRVIMSMQTIVRTNPDTGRDMVSPAFVSVLPTEYPTWETALDAIASLAPIYTIYATWTVVETNDYLEWVQPTPVVPGESVSHGTLLPKDLIPAFVSAIPDEAVRERYYRQMAAMDFDTTDQRAVDYLLEDLEDVLDAYAPDGHYFGAHPGNTSDYGWWPIEDDERR